MLAKFSFLVAARRAQCSHLRIYTLMVLFRKGKGRQNCRTFRLIDSEEAATNELALLEGTSPEKKLTRRAFLLALLEMAATNELALPEGTSPEKKLTRRAFLLALLEMAAWRVGSLNFIWATVVLLGGFAQYLQSKDFWFVSIILVLQGLCIFCRIGDRAIQRVPRPTGSRRFNLFLSAMALCSLLIREVLAITCIILSIRRLVRKHYGATDNQSPDRALRIFYGMSLLEALLNMLGSFLTTYFQIFVLIPVLKKRSLIWTVIDKYGLDESHVYAIQRFFNDACYRCVSANALDGLKMDFVSYSVELLQSSDYEDQVMGAQLLCGLLKRRQLASEKMKVIGTMPGLLNMLIEMLNWDKSLEQKIRRATAEIIYKLVKIPRNRIRVMAIPESMESIASLLYDSNQIKIHSKLYNGQSDDEYKYPDFTAQGLRILKILASDYDNSAKIRSNKELLRKIQVLTQSDPKPRNHKSYGISGSCQTDMLTSLPQKNGVIVDSAAETPMDVSEKIDAIVDSNLQSG